MGCFFSKDDSDKPKKNKNNNKSGIVVPVSVSFDFHGVKYNDCESFVSYALKNHPKAIGNQKLSQFIFISGKGKHSKDGKPVLKPMILDKCKEMNYAARVDPMNEGQIIVPLLK
ncbi:hypothetical protein M9Y10_013248 [Tritrichomonas musculus]|uniref:Smr domain-containing protein n=1 Tax=Tritrichomonas musculus TaxID=1915356 RepID=A0ABR2I7J4_9EUKA